MRLLCTALMLNICVIYAMYGTHIMNYQCTAHNSAARIRAFVVCGFHIELFMHEQPLNIAHNAMTVSIYSENTVPRLDSADGEASSIGQMGRRSLLNANDCTSTS